MLAGDCVGDKVLILSHVVGGERETDRQTDDKVLILSHVVGGERQTDRQTDR